MIRVLNRQTGLEKEMDGPKTVHELLREMSMVEASVLVMRRGELLTRDIRIDDGDQVEIIPVISGG